MQHEKGGKLEILNMSDYRPFVLGGLLQWMCRIILN